MRRSREFCQGVSNFLWQRFFFFKLVRGRERIQISHKSTHHRPASETPFEWRFAGGPMMAQYWILAWLLCDISGDPDQLHCYEILYSSVFFQEEGVHATCPPLDPRMGPSVNEFQLDWCFAGGPMAARNCMLAGFSTVLQAKSDSDVMFYLLSYSGTYNRKITFVLILFCG